MSAPGRDGGRKGLREPVPALALVIVPAAIALLPTDKAKAKG